MQSRRYIFAALAVAALIASTALLLLKPDWWGDNPAQADFTAYLRAEEPRELLMYDFRSYDSEQQVTQQLSAAKLAWTAERLHVEGTDRYPPYKLDTLTLDAYRHLGTEGRLSLEFFNNRLSTVVFRPRQPISYLRRLQSKGVKLQKKSLNTWEQQANHLRIHSNIIFATSKVGQTMKESPFVSWADTRLTAQARQWYADYGSKYAVTPIKSSAADSEP